MSSSFLEIAADLMQRTETTILRYFVDEYTTSGIQPSEEIHLIRLKETLDRLGRLVDKTEKKIERSKRILHKVEGSHQKQAIDQLDKEWMRDGSEEDDFDKLMLEEVSIAGRKVKIIPDDYDKLYPEKDFKASGEQAKSIPVGWNKTKDKGKDKDRSEIKDEDDTSSSSTQD